MATLRSAAWMAAVVAMGMGSVARAADQAEDTVDWPVQSFFLSDVAQVQNLGEVQTQAGVNFRRSHGENEWEAPLQAEVGVLPRLELSAELPWMSQQQSGTTARGLQNVELGTEFRILASEESGTAFSAGLGVEIPTGSAQVEDNSWTFRPRLRAFKKVGALGLNASLMPALARDRQSGKYAPRGELTAGVTLGDGGLIPTIEGRGALGDETGAEGMAGVRFKAGETFEVGAAALGGVRDGAPVYGGATNVLFQFGGR